MCLSGILSKDEILTAVLVLAKILTSCAPLKWQILSGEGWESDFIDEHLWIEDWAGLSSFHLGEEVQPILWEQGGAFLSSHLHLWAQMADGQQGW